MTKSLALIIISATLVRELAHHLVQSFEQIFFNDLGRATLVGIH